MHEPPKTCCAWPGCDRVVRSRHLCARDYKRAVKVGFPPGWPGRDGKPPSDALVRRLVTDWHRRPGGAADGSVPEAPDDTAASLPPPVQLHVAPPLPPLDVDDPLAAPSAPRDDSPPPRRSRASKRRAPPRRTVTVPADDPRLLWLYQQQQDVQDARAAAMADKSHTAVSSLFKEERAIRDQIDRERRRLEDEERDTDSGDLSELPEEVYHAKLEEHAMTLDSAAQEVYVRVWLAAVGYRILNDDGVLRITRISA